MRVFTALRRESPKILPLFLPIMISQYAGVANGVIDAATAGRLGTQALAGIAVGAAVWVPFLVFYLGIIYGQLIAVSQLHGADDRENIRFVTQQGMYLGILLGVAAGGLLHLLSFRLGWFGVEPGMASVAGEYVRAVIWALPVAGALFAVRFYCEGQKQVLPVTVIAVLSVGIKALGNYVFMFGHLGFPGLGVAGCGLATLIEYMFFFILLVVYVSRARIFSGERLFSRLHRPDIAAMLRIARSGVPIGLCLTSEFLVFSVMTMFISHYGAEAAAAHQVAFNCMILFFSMAAAFSGAACIRIGNLYGARNAVALREAVTGIVSLSLILGCLLMVGMIVGARYLAVVFSSDALVIPLAVTLLQLAAVFQIADSMQVCLNGVLRGLGDVGVPFLYTTACYWLAGIPLGYALSGAPLPFGMSSPVALEAAGWWAALTVSLILACMFLGLRVRTQIWGRCGVVARLETAHV